MWVNRRVPLMDLTAHAAVYTFLSYTPKTCDPKIRPQSQLATSESLKMHCKRKNEMEFRTQNREQIGNRP